ATLAVALVLIYRATGVVNFAQGELAMFSTFVAWTLTQHGFSYWPAFALTVVASFAGGIVLERGLIRPVERASVLTIAIVTIALGWRLATALGAVAGLMAAPPLGSFDQNFMQPILLYAFAGAVLGGIDSALGAVVGSLALGVFLNLVGTYVSWVGTDLRQAAA